MSDLDPQLQQFFDRQAARISVPERPAVRARKFPLWLAIGATVLAVALIATADVVLQANALADSEGAGCATLLQKVDAYFAANGKKPVSAQPEDISRAFVQLKAQCGKPEPRATNSATPKAP